MTFASFGAASRAATVGLLAAFAMLLSGCLDSTYSRGMFHGYVIGQEQTAIIQKIGAPASIDTSSADEIRLIYKNKTFDPDNMNAKDGTTVILLHRNGAGRMVADDIRFG